MAFVSALLLPATGLRAQSQNGQAFMGLTLGMKSNQALVTLKKSTSALNGLRFISGRRILNDTIPLTPCQFAMRRSIGFDSSNEIGAIGLTYKTTPQKIEDARTCAYNWLSSIYGKPTLVDTSSGVKVEAWTLGNARLTLEAKGYTENDYFVLIYYYPFKDKS